MINPKILKFRNRVGRLYSGVLVHVQPLGVDNIFLDDLFDYSRGQGILNAVEALNTVNVSPSATGSTKIHLLRWALSILPALEAVWIVFRMNITLEI